MIATLRRMDWRLNLAVFLVAIMGLATLLSGAPVLFHRQLWWFVAGLFILFLLPFVNLKSILNYRWIIAVIFLLSLFLLILTQIIGLTVHGSRSWIPIGSFHLQASELAKFALIVVLAAFFSRRHVGIRRLEVIFYSFLYFVLPTFLILLEPDLGSAIIFLGLWIGFLLVSEMPVKYFLFALPAIALVLFLAWNFGFRDYQKQRILAVFSPTSDVLGVNYNVIQSKIALGSAGLWGKGFGQGTQTKLGFLPEAQTDFIFPAFVEEWGIVGAVVLLLSYFCLIYRIAVIGIRAYGNFYKFFCLGAMILFSFQLMINIGSTLGFIPVIGVVFPLLSYGGSNFLTSFLILGIIQNIAVQSNA